MTNESLRIGASAASGADRRRSRSAGRWETEGLVRAAFVVILGFGLALRLLASLTLTPHVDEAASVLAAQIVGEQFVPILPSGNVYFQGFTLSLILTPLTWLGLVDLDGLMVVRLVSVVIGTAIIPVSYRLALRLTGNHLGALTVALLVALDPLSVQWSGHVRMYALLELIAFGLAWVWIDVIAGLATGRQLASGVLLGWLAVFTHSGASLLVGSILLAVVLANHGRVLRQRGLQIAMVTLAAAPIALLLLNRVLRPPSVLEAAAGEEEGVAFVGDSLLRPFARFLDDSFASQLATVQSESAQLWLLSVLPVAVATFAGMVLLIGRHELKEEARAAIWYVSVTFWCTVMAFIVFTDSLAGRYLLHVYSVGYLLIPLLLVEMVRRMPGLRGSALRIGAIAVSVALVLVMILSSLGRTVWRLENPVMNADYHLAMEYVVDHYKPGRAVIVALPPVAYLALGEENSGDIYFLAGPEGEARAEAYSRIVADGRRIDYWVGVDTIVSADGLRQLLLKHPDALLVVDSYRLWAAYNGEIRELIMELTVPVYQGPGGVLVMAVEAPQIGPRPQSD